MTREGTILQKYEQPLPLPSSPPHLLLANALPSQLSVTVPSGLEKAPGHLQRGLNSQALCCALTSHQHPKGKLLEIGKAHRPEDRGGERRVSRRRADHQVLTFPLGPPPPPPLRLASELAAQPSGPSAGPQHRCHG